MELIFQIINKFSNCKEIFSFSEEFIFVLHNNFFYKKLYILNLIPLPVKNFTVIFLLSFFFAQISLSQISDIPTSENLKFKTHNLLGNSKLSEFSLTSPLNKEDFDTHTPITIFILLFNPVLMLENEKVNFGLTKEVSLAFPLKKLNDFPAFGKLGFEYTYFFRDERSHHLRSSFDIHIPAEGKSDFVIFTYSFGAGYFTDFKKSGFFPQASINLIVPTCEYFAINPYVRLRHTFMLDKTQRDNTDLSVGVGLMFLSFF